MKQIIDSFDSLSEIYGTLGTDTKFQKKVRKKTIGLARRKKGKLLEIGCGNGLFLVEFSKKSEMDLYGVDFSKKMLLRVKRRTEEAAINNLKFCLGVAQNLPFQKNSFDVVVCINTLHSLPDKSDREKAIKQMMRVCKPDGKLILDIRNKLNPWVYFRYKYLSRRIPVGQQLCKIPLNPFSLREISKILEKGKFKIFNELPIGFPLKILAPIIILEAKPIEDHSCFI